MPTHTYMVLTAPKEGHEAEFNAFYEQQHIPDVLRVPGFTGCRRLRLSQDFASSAGAASYVALYELTTDDPAACIAEVRRRLGTAEMPRSGFSDPSKAGAILYDVIFEASTPAPISRAFDSNVVKR
jgi:hypothetical protein